MIFNEKVILNISSNSNSKNPPWNLLSFASRIVVNECLKNSVWNCFTFTLVSNYCKTIKTLGFYNNTHLRDQSSLDVSSRGVFWALLNFYDGTFGKSIKGLLAVNYFRKTLHFRYLRGLPVCLCHLWHKFSICILNQMKREHIPINVLLNP